MGAVRDGVGVRFEAAASGEVLAVDGLGLSSVLSVSESSKILGLAIAKTALKSDVDAKVSVTCPNWEDEGEVGPHVLHRSEGAAKTLRFHRLSSPGLAP